VVNQRHTGRIKALLDDAKARGARTLTGGDVDEQNCYIAPTLLDNIPTTPNHAGGNSSARCCRSSPTTISTR